MNKHLPRAASALLLATLLAACGGGGDEAGLPVLNNYAVATGYKNLLAADKTWTVNGQGSNGLGYAATIKLEPLAPGAFPLTGMNTARTRQTLSFSAGTAPVDTLSVSVGYYDAASGTPFGSVDAEDGSCSRVTASSALPASANTGSSGPLSEEADLASCSITAASTATATTRWSLETARGSAGGAFALLCLESSVSASATAPAGTVATCAEIDTAGNLGNRARLMISIPTLGFRLTATNY